MAETILGEPTAKSVTYLFQEAREASQIPLFVGDFSSAASNGGSAAVRLRKLELEEKWVKREERQAEKEERKTI